MSIQSYLLSHRLITDGAMGTYYNECYSKEDLLVEQVNLLYPERIRQIHSEYLKSGARLIRTNSFACNSSFFEDEDTCIASARESYRIAKQAIQQFREDTNCDEEIFIACDIGTIYEADISEEGALQKEYFQLIDAFCEEGGDIFLFETQTDIRYLFELADYIKQKNPQAFLMVSFSVDLSGFTHSGIRIERLLYEVGIYDAFDAIGLNCGMEGMHMYHALSDMTFVNDKYLITLPNASYSVILRGKTKYAKNIDYFVTAEISLAGVGANIMGGCCGTTPMHIARIKEALEQIPIPPKAVSSDQRHDDVTLHSKVIGKINSGEKPFIVELDPPFDADISKVMSGAKLLQEHDVDLLTLSDSPLGRSRMDASMLASAVKKECKLDVMPHLTCRDRNIVGLRGVILGDYANQIHHFLIVTGDPIPQGERTNVTQVFDYNSIRFMNLLKEMNEDVFTKEQIVYGGALNYHGANIDAIAARMQQKMQQGCSYFLTQPIYSLSDIKRLKELKEMTGAKIMAGIMPLVSYKNAMFIANQMPGIHVPEDIIVRYQPNLTREEYEEIAVDICVKIAVSLGDVADGYYFMTPFNRVSLICHVIEEIRKEVLI